MRTTAVNVWQQVTANVFSTGMQFQANDWFVIRLYADSQGMGFLGNAYWPNDPYPGDFYENGQLVPGTANMGFRTWVWTGPGLEVLGSCPGPVTIAADNGTPGGSMAILHGVPGNSVQGNPAKPCFGTVLSLQAPMFVGFLPLNAGGAGSLGVNLPAAACGRVLQLVDVGSCLPTNPIVLQ